MAFGNYYGSTITPYQAYYQPQITPQPMIGMPVQGDTTNANAYTQPQQQRQNYQQNNAQIQTTVLWVNDETEAKNAFVLANNTVLIMQKDMTKFYIKSADSLGRTTLDEYNCSKANNNTENAPKTAEKQADSLDLSKFITRDEVAEMIPKNEDYVTHNELKEALEKITTTVKKTTAKKEN